MAKKKPQSKQFQIFLLGLVIGAALTWIPLDREFSPAQFTASIFTEQFPTTTPVIKRDGYTLAYNGQTRNAHWVYHKLTQENLTQKLSRDDCEFKEDPDLPEHIRATKIDFAQSGFDRGHLCPAADCPTPRALEHSFFLSNISPQDPAFNRGYWRIAEKHVRDLTNHYKAVHVFTGPLYLSSKGRDGKTYVKYEVIGPQHVAVPTHFFMLIFVESSADKLLSKGYIFPNKAIDAKTPLKKFSASVEEIESASGVLFTKIATIEMGHF
ncbi:MAG: DNA/RNA non-specific endonuclease [Verrucomicrobia bacterium]|nr:DNA/RNA non-specific endonuclease [Verrucomicrobiota bacterium]